MFQEAKNDSTTIAILRRENGGTTALKHELVENELQRMVVHRCNAFPQHKIGALAWERCPDMTVEFGGQRLSLSIVSSRDAL